VIVPSLGNISFFLNPFQFIVHDSFCHLTLYYLDTDSIVKQPTKGKHHQDYISTIFAYQSAAQKEKLPVICK
jgi:hypothetical protein